MKKKILPFMIILLVAASLLSGCGSERGYDAGAVQISKTNSNIVYIMAGKVEATEKADIASKIMARVAAISVDIGAPVKKGEPIIKLDDRDLQALVEQGQAGVNAAQANLEKVLGGARPEQIEQAQAALDSAKAGYENALNNYNRSKQLYDAGTLSGAQLEQAETSLTSAEAMYKSAGAALEMMKKGETSATINILQSQLKQAKAALALTQTQLSNGTIVAPIDGIVSARNISAGELAAPGVPVVTIVNPDAVIVSAYLPAAQVNKIKVGQKVFIKVSEVPDKVFNGEIMAIDPAIDAKSKTVLVKVSFVNRDQLLKPGMLAEVGYKN